MTLPPTPHLRRYGGDFVDQPACPTYAARLLCCLCARNTDSSCAGQPPGQPRGRPRLQSRHGARSGRSRGRAHASAATAFMAASSRSSAVMTLTSLFCRISLPRSTLVPSSRTINGTVTPTCACTRRRHVASVRSQTKAEQARPVLAGTMAGGATGHSQRGGSGRQESGPCRRCATSGQALPCQRCPRRATPHTARLAPLLPR